MEYDVNNAEGSWVRTRHLINHGYRDCNNTLQPWINTWHFSTDGSMCNDISDSQNKKK